MSARKEVVFTPSVPKPVGHFGRPAYYSQAVKGGNLVFISGMTGRKVDPSAKEGWTMVKGDAKAQAIQAMENIVAVLKEVGGSIDDVVKLVTYITDRKYFDDVGRVLNMYFTRNCPANTLVFVKGLALEEYLVELDATAIVR